MSSSEKTNRRGREKGARLSHRARRRKEVQKVGDDTTNSGNSWASEKSAYEVGREEAM